MTGLLVTGDVEFLHLGGPDLRSVPPTALLAALDQASGT